VSVLINEKELVIRLNEGDYSSFDRLYQYYAKSIFTKIKKIVISHAVAEEIHQDVFLKIWQQRAQLNADIPFQSILFQTAKNLAINYYWKSSRDDKMKAHFINQATAFYDHLDDYINFSSTNEALKKAIDQLPPQRRKIFILCKMEGKSYEFAAAEYGVSLSTVKDHMSKAMQSIRKRMLHNLAPVVPILLKFIISG